VGIFYLGLEDLDLGEALDEYLLGLFGDLAAFELCEFDFR